MNPSVVCDVICYNYFWLVTSNSNVGWLEKNGLKNERHLLIFFFFFVNQWEDDLAVLITMLVVVALIYIT